MRSAVVWIPTLVLFASCASSSSWHADDALSAESLEMQYDEQGARGEVEYHILPEAVPAEVRASMDALHPGGRAVAAEKEYHGSTLYWELTKEIAGREIEAMFHPDGTLHSEEVEVAMSSVPAAVQATVANSGYGMASKWEEIRDGERMLVEYHVKTVMDGRHYKLQLSTSGALLAVWREVPAEIEVPVPH
jgi:hypothetical protein